MGRTSASGSAWSTPRGGATLRSLWLIAAVLVAPSVLGSAFADLYWDESWCQRVEGNPSVDCLGDLAFDASPRTLWLFASLVALALAALLLALATLRSPSARITVGRQLTQDHVVVLAAVTATAVFVGFLVWLSDG